MKRSFVLLEALIALSLLVMFGVFFILKPFDAYKTELKLFKKAEKERLADWTFAEVREKILKKEMSRLPDVWIDLLDHKKMKVERSFVISKYKEKMDVDETIFQWLKITVILKDDTMQKYHYDLCISEKTFSALYEERTRGPA